MENGGFAKLRFGCLLESPCGLQRIDALIVVASLSASSLALRLAPSQSNNARHLPAPEIISASSSQAEDKQFFIHWMNAYAQFCGVRVLTYCVMDNHFHMLVDVPRFEVAEAQDLGDEELLRRLSFVSTEAQLQQWREWLEQSHGVGLATAQEKNEAQEKKCLASWVWGGFLMFRNGLCAVF